MSTRESRKRWYEKNKNNHAFKAKNRAASLAKYYADRLIPERLELQRANRRKAAKVQNQKIKTDPVKLQYRREYSNRRCVNLSDAYVAERLKLKPEKCPREFIELMRAHIRLQREIRKPKQLK